MAQGIHTQSIFTFSKCIPQFISDARAFKTTLSKAIEQNLITIAPQVITTFENNLDLLVEKQTLVKSRVKGAAATRDNILDKVVTNVRQLVIIVQIAADKVRDINARVALIHGCGLKTRKPRVLVKPDFKVTNNKHMSGLLHLVSKAARKNDKASYEWQWSRDGITFIGLKVTTTCKTIWESGVEPGTILYFRKRVITNKVVGVPTWSQTIWVVVL